MSMRLFKAFGLAGFAGAVLLIAPAPARASFLLTITVGGDSATYNFGDAMGTFVGSASGTFTSSGPVGNEKIEFIGDVDGLHFDARTTNTNSPGTALLAKLNLSGGEIDNNNLTATTFTISSSADGYMQPASPPPVRFSASGTTNQQSGTTSNATFSATAGLFALSTNIPNASDTDSKSSPTATAVVFLPAPYTMTATLTATLSGSGTIGNIGGTAAITTTPEPSTLVALAAGAPVIGLGRWLRRRKVASA